MNITKRILSSILACIVLCVSAKADTISDYLDQFKSAVPDKIENAYENLELGQGIPGFEIIFNQIKGYLTELIQGPLKMGAVICTLLIIMGIFQSFSRTTDEGTANLLDLSVNLAMSVLLFSFSALSFEGVFEYVKTLSDFSLALSPIVIGISLINGNVSLSSVTGSGIILFVSLCEFVVVALLIPILRIVIALGASSSINNSYIGDASGFTRFLKSLYTIILSFCVMLFCSVLSYQSIVMSAADSFAQKSIRFSLGAAIPIVGASLGEAVKTVGGALSLLKSTVGAAACSVVLSLLLPCIINLLLHRLTLNFCSAIGRMLGCDKQVKLLDEVGSVCGMCVALVCVISLMVIFLLSVFAVTASGIGG